MGDLTTSNRLFKGIDPHKQPPATSDEFLTHPIFGKQNGHSTEDVDSVLQRMGISQTKIRQSHMFENQVTQLLGSWIDEYSRRIMALSHMDQSDPLYPTQVAQIKILLMSIYHQAETIAQHSKEEADLQVYMDASPNINAALKTEPLQPIVFSQNMLMAYATHLQQNGGPKAEEGGSCPAIEMGTNPIEMRSAPPSSYELFQNLMKGKTPESLMMGKERYEDYKCPHKGCGKMIQGEIIGKPETWKTECPHCHQPLHCAT